MISKKSFYIPAYQVSFFEGRLKDSEHTAYKIKRNMYFYEKFPDTNNSQSDMKYRTMKQFLRNLGRIQIQTRFD